MEMLAWIRAHSGLMGALALLSAAMLVASLLLLPWAVARLPHDAFQHPRAATPPAIRSPWAHAAVHLAKNLLGVFLVLAGVAMLLLPGQGILTILLGLLLVDLPGRRRLLFALVRRAPVFRALNWMRRRAHERPFLPPPPAVRSD